MTDITIGRQPSMLFLFHRAIDAHLLALRSKYPGVQFPSSPRTRIMAGQRRILRLGTPDICSDRLLHRPHLFDRARANEVSDRPLPQGLQQDHANLLLDEPLRALRVESALNGLVMVTS